MQETWPDPAFSLTLVAGLGTFAGTGHQTIRTFPVAGNASFPQPVMNAPMGSTLLGWYRDPVAQTGRWVEPAFGTTAAAQLRTLFGGEATSGTLIARWSAPAEVCPECNQNPCVCEQPPVDGITITFDAGVGGIVSINNQRFYERTVAPGASFWFPTASRGTVAFTGWYLGETRVGTWVQLQSMIGDSTEVALVARFPATGADEPDGSGWVWVVLITVLLIAGVGVAFVVLRKRQRHGYGG